MHTWGDGKNVNPDALGNLGSSAIMDTKEKQAGFWDFEGGIGKLKVAKEKLNSW